ncbi:unnamed protein product, partial [Rotaria sp. Silwood1]
MKSQDFRKVVMRMIDDGMPSIEIEKQLRNVVNQRTIRRWQNLYKETGEIDLKKSTGRPKIVRTKGLIQKVKQRLVYKGRQSARYLAKSFGVSSETMRRIIKDDLNLRVYRITTQPKLTDDHRKRRVSFASWVRKFLRKEDHRKILFTDEKYFSVEGVFNRKNERVYAVSRLEADEQGGINEKSKYSKRIMVWLGASKNGLTSPIIFEPGETLSHKNYIEVLLPHAQSEGERLLGEDFIYQQDNATPHVHRKSLAWCEANFNQFIGNHKWPPNSPDLNVLDYYVWDAITHNMQWNKVKDYDTLIDEIRKGIRRVPKDDLLRSVKNWSCRI